MSRALHSALVALALPAAALAAAAPARAAQPRVRIPAMIAVARDGSFRVAVTCPPGGARCTGETTVTAAVSRVGVMPALLGGGRVAVAAGRTERELVRLHDDAARRMRRRGRLSAEVRVFVRRGGGREVIAERRVVLRPQR